MGLKLWQRIIINMLFPIVISLALIYVELRNVNRIHISFSIIEVVDDINLLLLELRRYEKNTLLLIEEKENLELFHNAIGTLRSKAKSIENEIVLRTNTGYFFNLMKNIDLYEQAFEGLVVTIDNKQRLIEDIRPLGREIENLSPDKKMALVLRKYEKNYLLYKEKKAMDEVYDISKSLIDASPAIKKAVGLYTENFREIVDNDAAQNDTLQKMRQYAREIEKYTTGFSSKERAHVNTVMINGDRAFLYAALFIVFSTIAIAYMVSQNMIKVMREMEHAFDNINEDSFTHVIKTDTHEEMQSFIGAYNRVVSKLNYNLKDTSNKIKTALQTLSQKQADITEKNNSLRAISEEILSMVKEKPLNIAKTRIKLFVIEAIKAASDVYPGIPVSSNIAELPDTLNIDAALLRPALYNVIVNAMRFSPYGGKVTVAGTVENSHAAIYVSDTGPSIPDDISEKVFEPSFTTMDGAPGLGLTIARAAIERHSGTIAVDKTKQGGGTVMKITLPLIVQ
ncbi:MAG: sensor histidine kinase [Candidatus Magnetominusculus sp. LBB02]|nr:sensor histidine kinase [Candidatus Magnetominusculus sp. LBB02]